MLALAGAILLGAGFLLTLYLVSLALQPGGIAPAVPIAVGAPPLLLGYIACHFASLRMVKAKALAAERKRARKPAAPRSKKPQASRAAAKRSVGS